jgi:hypothetical protein
VRDWIERERESVCVCVCERERESENASKEGPKGARIRRLQCVGR